MAQSGPPDLGGFPVSYKLARCWNEPLPQSACFDSGEPADAIRPQAWHTEQPSPQKIAPVTAPEHGDDFPCGAGDTASDLADHTKAARNDLLVSGP